MGQHCYALPQLKDGIFLTDGGLETTLVFHQGLDLPCFAAFVLLRDEIGREILANYYRTYARLARQHGTGFVLESATWRANPDWGRRLGYSLEELAAANRQAIEMLETLRTEWETPTNPMVISGNIGPRGDGYVPGQQMSEAEAEEYHDFQVDIFARSAADMISAFTINYVEEAIGIVRAAVRRRVPVVISFTVETDGRLPTGQPLQDAIGQVDAATGAAPAYYMLNCAHPEHFRHVLESGAGWTGRIRGLRANASRCSHAELDEATELDAGDPRELGLQYRDLRTLLPGLSVLGGCCGTDHRHVEQICLACRA